jgi:hypothetical protein
VKSLTIRTRSMKTRTTTSRSPRRSSSTIAQCLFQFDGLGIAFPDPKDFHVHVSVAFLSVGGAASQYTLGVSLIPKRNGLSHA